MNTKPLIYYGLALVCVIIAVIVFLKTINWWALVILVFVMAATLLIRQGIEESGKKGG
jgi:hypothetical protein